jgi:hypothetical protein
VITAFGLALAVLATGSRLIAAAGAGFALATLGGYLLSVWIGLFGVKEIRTTAGIVAGVIEVAAFAALAALAATPPRKPSRGYGPPMAAGSWLGCKPASPARDRRWPESPSSRWWCWASRWRQRADRQRPPAAAP